MAAYSINTAAALAVLRNTEAELAALGPLSADLQGVVDAAGSSLGASPVARALVRYAAETLLHDLRAGLVGSARALESVRSAVAEYAAADEEMRVRAEAAAAAVPAVAARAGPGRVSAPPPVPQPPPPDAEPDRGSVVPLPGPPPWRPIRPRMPLPVLPNPMLPKPTLPSPMLPPVPQTDPPQWMKPPAGLAVPPGGWWACQPGWWRRPPDSAKWPGWFEFPWPWSLRPLPGCPGPLPDRSFGPFSGCYYPLVPLENPLLKIRIEPPVARMLEGLPGSASPTPASSVRASSVPALAPAAAGRRTWSPTTWGLT